MTQFAVSEKDVKAILKIRRRLQQMANTFTNNMFQGSFFSTDALVAEKGTPKQGWTYYNSSIGQTLNFNKGAWYQLTIDGENGSAVSYGGASNTAPSSPSVDDAYLDSHDDIVYIYNGVAWEIMSQTGGTVTVTYHDSNLNATPSDPTGSGEAGGWHLDSTEDVNWLSQRIGAGDWKTPIPSKNLIDAGDALAVANTAQAAADAAQTTADAAISNIDMPVTTGIVFTKSGSNVTWTTGTLKYKGVDYTIAAEVTGDTNKFIYWNLDGTTTVFATTNTIADATPTAGEPDRWVMCYNDAGTPSQAVPFKVLHAGLIQANTITADKINVTNIAAINADLGTITGGSITLSGLNGAEEAEATARYQMRLDGGGLQGRWRASGDPTAWGDWKNIIDITDNLVRISFDSFESGEFIPGVGTAGVSGNQTIFDGTASSWAKTVNNSTPVFLSESLHVSDSFTLADSLQAPVSAVVNVTNVGDSGRFWLLRFAVYDDADDSLLGFTGNSNSLIISSTGLKTFLFDGTDFFVNAGASVGDTIYLKGQIRDTTGASAGVTFGNSTSNNIIVDNVGILSAMIKA